MVYFFIFTIIVVNVSMKYAFSNDEMTTIKLATVLAAVAEVSAILSRAYIAELEDTRRNLLTTNITIRMTRTNLTALDANNHAHFTSTLSDRHVKIHSIWFSESENVLAPPLVTNYYKAIMCDCRIYKRHRPYDKSTCFSRPEDIEKPFPFSKAIMQDVTVSRFSVKPKPNSSSELRHNFTYILGIAGVLVTLELDYLIMVWAAQAIGCNNRCGV